MNRKPLTKGEPVVFHFRIHAETGQIASHSESNISSRGGVTVVYLPDEQVMRAAVCSMEDNYNRSIGRRIATSRPRISREADDCGREYFAVRAKAMDFALVVWEDYMANREAKISRAMRSFVRSKFRCNVDFRTEAQATIAAHCIGDIA